MFNPMIPFVVDSMGSSCDLSPLFASHRCNGLLHESCTHASTLPTLPFRNKQLTYVPSNDVLDL